MREQLSGHLTDSQDQPITTVLYILLNNKNTLSKALELVCDCYLKEFAIQSTKQLHRPH